MSTYSIRNIETEQNKQYSRERINALYKSKLLRTDNEIKTFEENLELLSETFDEGDIVELCSVFDDNTEHSEVMFGMVHLLETLSSEEVFENTVKGLIKMSETSPEWTDIIVGRCLNDKYSVQMINRVKNRLDEQSAEKFKELWTKGSEGGTANDKK